MEMETSSDDGGPDLTFDDLDEHFAGAEPARPVPKNKIGLAIAGLGDINPREFEDYGAPTSRVPRPRNETRAVPPPSGREMPRGGCTTKRRPITAWGTTSPSIPTRGKAADFRMTTVNGPQNKISPTTIAGLIEKCKVLRRKVKEVHSRHEGELAFYRKENAALREELRTKEAMWKAEKRKLKKRILNLDPQQAERSGKSRSISGLKTVPKKHHSSRRSSRQELTSAPRPETSEYRERQSGGTSTGMVKNGTDSWTRLHSGARKSRSTSPATPRGDDPENCIVT
uniref:Uncharacterized protein n=1 Tax=Lotharella globosa TaxID=91324 RepID=A0A7S4DWK7_9EUKA|mmetsp:Transcript_14310/g.28860  ORF Transcript_14310/g.28860 Transcript_14310/m.28860 type:complete len:284 (-) Transcript_14310:307-1158(-)